MSARQRHEGFRSWSADVPGAGHACRTGRGPGSIPPERQLRGGALSCQARVGDLKALPPGSPRRPDSIPTHQPHPRVRMRGGQNPYNVFVYQTTVAASTPLCRQSANSYVLSGGSVFNDILMSSEPVPPPPIASGTVRVELFQRHSRRFDRLRCDVGGITSQRNFLRTNGLEPAESQGVAGDWILRMGILPPSSAPALILDVVVPEGSTGISQPRSRSRFLRRPASRSWSTTPLRRGRPPPARTTSQPPET